MTDIFQGDPRLFLTEDGASLTFLSGQPVMDAKGYINTALISLFTRQGWCGNSLFDDVDHRIGSDFMTEVEKPITSKSLPNIKQIAEQVLKSDLYKRVEVEVVNPSGYRLDISVLLYITETAGLNLVVSYSGPFGSYIVSPRVFGDMNINFGDMILEFGDTELW